MVKDLRVTSVDFVAAKPVEEKNSRATVRLTNRFTIDEFGPWTAHGLMRLVQRDDHWFVDWSPQEIDTELRTGERFVRTVSWADRAPILGAGGVPLTTSATLVTVGIQGSRIKNAQQVSAALQVAGATAAQVARADRDGDRAPDLVRSRLRIAGGDVPPVQAADLSDPGHRLPYQRRAPSPITADLAAHVVGRVGAITAEQLEHLGAPYRATDVVGQTGIEAAYERQLAGTPGGTIGVVDATGKRVATLATFRAKRGTPVRTTIEPAVQRAAEHALDAAPACRRSSRSGRRPARSSLRSRGRGKPDSISRSTASTHRDRRSRS